MFCNDACADPALVGNPGGGCAPNTFRKTTTSRILYFACSTDFPNDFNCAAVKALFDAGEIVATSELANVVWDDPQTEQQVISECRPPVTVVVSRTLNFEDRIAVNTDTASPPVSDPYHDYKFWQDKIDNKSRIRAAIAYCNGDVKIAKDVDGSYMTFDMLPFISYQKPGTTGPAWIEFKKVAMVFAGDPLAFTPPDFNLDECGISI